MKDIFTVTLFLDGENSSVSFMNFDDAVNYAIDEVMKIASLDHLDEDELREIFIEDRYFQPWDDSDDFISIDDTKLCTSYKRGSL